MKNMQGYTPGGWVAPSRARPVDAPSLYQRHISMPTGAASSLTPKVSPQLTHRSISAGSEPASGDGPTCLRLGAEEVIYSKNNVCVHPTAECGSPFSTKSEIHVLGNLSVRCRGRSILTVGSSLIIHWIPNAHMSGAKSQSTAPLPASVSTFTVSQLPCSPDLLLLHTHTQHFLHHVPRCHAMSDHISVPTGVQARTNR